MSTPEDRKPDSAARDDAGQRRNPVELLLGPDAATAGPWSLLGLEPGAVTDRQVALALERRLAHVNRHPLGGTPEADDVRLALHTAAAQVLHPEVRLRLLASQRASAPQPDSPTPPDAAQARGRHAAASRSPALAARTGLDLRADRTPPSSPDPMLRIIAMHGGLNERSIRQVMLFAGLSHTSPKGLADELRDRLIAWSHHRRGSPSTRAAATPAEMPRIYGSAAAAMGNVDLSPIGIASRPSDAEIDPGVRALKIIVVSALAVIAAAAVIVIGISMLLNKPAPSKSTPGAGESTIADAAGLPRKELFPAASESAKPERSPSVPKDTANTTAPDADPVSLVRELAATAADVTAQPEAAITRFQAAVTALSTRWHVLAPDQLGAAQDSVVEFLYRAPSPEIAGAAIDAVISLRKSVPGGPWRAERVRSELWLAGLRERLSRERDLPAAVRDLIDRASPDASPSTGADGGTFVHGALARLSAIPAELAAPPANGLKPPPPSPAEARQTAEAWDAWRDACRLLNGSDADACNRILLAGLETLLAEGPEPLSDHGLAQVAKDLTLAISWRKDSPARGWLVASFSSDRLSSSDLQIVTSALAGQSSAEGVDAKMILTEGADEKTRLELRDSYASAWGLSDPARKDELLAAWREKVNAQELATTAIDPEDDLHTASLASALTRARLNLAATMIWAGLIEEPAPIVHDAGGPSTTILSQVAAASAPRRIDEGGTDGAWAVQYLVAEQRVPDRLRLLTELLKANRPLGQLDAQIVVTEAARGSPESVRAAAGDVVERSAASPAVVYALLQESFRIPRTRSNAALVGSIVAARIPSIKDTNWYAGVRRALVERLLQLLASRGPERAIDRLSEELASTCTGRAKPSAAAAQATAVPSGARAPAAPSALDSIKDLASQCRRNAETMLPTGREPCTLDQIDRRLSSRVAMASGTVQLFEAHHVAVAELMGYIVSIEQPSQAGQVAEVLEKLASDRRRARHIMDQIDATELAMMRLWRIRLQGGPSA